MFYVCVRNGGLGRMKTILKSLLQCPQRQTFPFITYHIAYYILHMQSLFFRPLKTTFRTRKTWSRLHWCSLLIPAFVWVEGGGSICQPPPLWSWLVPFFCWLLCFWASCLCTLLGLARYYAISSFHQGLAFICRLVIHSLGFCFEVQILI